MAQFPSSTAANGVWSLTDVRNAVMGSNWPSASLVPMEYLVVAGGGAGGGNGGGGGGAGGLLYSASTNFQFGIVHTVTVGAGGAYVASNLPGGSGTASSITASGFTSVTATGGGGGASRSGTNATNGGSGGGGGDAFTIATRGPGLGTVGPPRQGFNGGASTDDNGGAGGGGAGAAGANASGGNPTAGGVGVLYSITVNFAGTASTSSNTTLNITAVSAGVIGVGTRVTGSNIPANTFIVRLGTGTGGTGTYIMSSSATSTTAGVAITSTGAFYAGGGAGGRCPGLGSQTAAGGAGGGGASVAQAGPSIAGAANTGGGGGGGGNNGAAGGSGVVIIKYSDYYPAATSTTGSPTITVAGGYRIYQFTASGSITF